MDKPRTTPPASRGAGQSPAEAADWYHAVIETSPDGFFSSDPDGKILDVNAAFVRMSGYSREELLSLNIRDIEAQESGEETGRHIEKIMRQGSDLFETIHRRRDGSLLHVEANVSFKQIAGGRLLCFCREITERKRSEDELRVSNRFLEIVHSHNDVNSLLKTFVAEIMRYTDCEAVGIRMLDDQGRIPYGAYEGFSRQFYETESPLSVKTDHCMCINVIAGITDSSLPFYTSHGSFYMNATTRFLATVSEDDKGRTRNVCNKTGYESVALIPFREEGHISGLIHVADRREHMVPLPLVEMLEMVALHLGTALKRVRAEDALRQSEERFSVAFHSSPIGIILSSRTNGRIIDANTSYCRMIGFEREELIGRTTVDLGLWVDPSDRNRLLFVLDHGMPIQNMEVRFRTRSGEERVLQTSMAAIAIAGEPCLISSAIDITERKRAEDALRQSEAFVRRILDTVDEGFLIIDRQLRIMNSNRAVCRLVGSGDDDLTGRLCHEVMYRSSLPCFENGAECAVHEVFQTGEPQTVIRRCRPRAGRDLVLETKAYPVRDAAGAVTAAIKTVVDITEKHLLEEERLKTQKLESIGTLAGGIAHDFNNLLQGIFGYIAMAKMTHGDREKSISMLTQAEEALQLTVNLTSQLLTYAKGGKPAVKLIRLMPTIGNAAKFALSGSQTGCILVGADDLWPVAADAGQVAQVIQNIVLNASEAMAGSGKVSIFADNALLERNTVAGLPAGGRYVRIAIQDDGAGIAAENLPKIFDPYFTTKQRGSGLGLATSYSIIRNHGGVIEAESEVSRGTTFTIYLPAAEGGEAQQQAGGGHSRLQRQGRVLFMDDEALMRTVAAEMIAALGHEVTVAADGAQAVALFTQARDTGRPFDVVILDLTVRGGVGGEEAVRRLRDIDPGVIAVVSSGYADNEVVARYREYGFAAVLGKPYKIEALRDCLEVLLGES